MIDCAYGAEYGTPHSYEIWGGSNAADESQQSQVCIEAERNIKHIQNNKKKEVKCYGENFE